MDRILTYEEYCDQERNGFSDIFNGDYNMSSAGYVYGSSYSYGIGGNSGTAGGSTPGNSGGGGAAGSIVYGSYSYSYSTEKNKSYNELHSHETVIRILKGDFERNFGLTFDKFIEIYNEILTECPEKLI